MLMTKRNYAIKCRVTVQAISQRIKAGKITLTETTLPDGTVVNYIDTAANPIVKNQAPWVKGKTKTNN